MSKMSLFLPAEQKRLNEMVSMLLIEQNCTPSHKHKVSNSAQIFAHGFQEMDEAERGMMRLLT